MEGCMMLQKAVQKAMDVMQSALLQELTAPDVVISSCLQAHMRNCRLACTRLCLPECTTSLHSYQQT